MYMDVINKLYNIIAIAYQLLTVAVLIIDKIILLVECLSIHDDVHIYMFQGKSEEQFPLENINQLALTCW